MRGWPTSAAEVSTQTCAAGARRSRTARTARTISENCGWIVGSPCPAKVIAWTAGCAASAAATSATTAATVGKPRRATVVTSSVVSPHSQYTQSNEQTLRPGGRRLIPSDSPSRRD